MKSLIKNEARLCNRGEGLFLSLISEYAIVHQVKGTNDIGIDFFCEWLSVDNNTSSNILFGVQLKSVSSSKVKVEENGTENQLNMLNKFNIKYISSGQPIDSLIEDKTIDYWRGFDIPIYLFVSVISDTTKSLYYKRYTPILHHAKGRESELFYKVNNEGKFLGFATTDKKGGFCRDLFIDSLRCSYFKGALLYKSPKEYGLNQFEEDKIYEFIEMDCYKDKINSTIKLLKKYGYKFN